MGYYFEKASKNLLDAFREQKIPVSVWNGQKVVRTTSDQLSFSFAHADIDSIFSFSSITYILTYSPLLNSVPTIPSSTDTSKIITYIIPLTKDDESFIINIGPNSNRIICVSDYDMKRILKSAISVI